MEAKRTDPRAKVPWSGFDLINALNAWKRSEAAGRISLSPGGTIAKHVTGLAWRHEVSAQVFEEAAVDLGRALSAYAHARSSKGDGRVGFPRRRRRGRCRDTPRSDQDHGGWVGIDRGLAVFAVAAMADGAFAGCFHAPAPLQRNLVGLQQRSRALPRARPRSRHQGKAIRQLSRFHARIANVRRSFLHEVSSQLVKTHDRLCLEDLTVDNLIRNKHLARAITDASWAEFARQLAYKQAWRGGQVMVADRWFPSTKTCSRCGRVKDRMGLAERLFLCARAVVW